MCRTSTTISTAPTPHLQQPCCSSRPGTLTALLGRGCSHQDHKIPPHCFDYAACSPLGQVPLIHASGRTTFTSASHSLLEPRHPLPLPLSLPLPLAFAHQELHGFPGPAAGVHAEAGAHVPEVRMPAHVRQPGGDLQRPPGQHAHQGVERCERCGEGGREGKKRMRVLGLSQALLLFFVHSCDPLRMHLISHLDMPRHALASNIWRRAKSQLSSCLAPSSNSKLQTPKP